MPNDPDATTTSPSDWKYVSEGGATIVFSYAGPPRPDFKRTVLRLRKSVTHPPPKPIQKPLDLAKEWGRKKEDGLEEAWKARSILNEDTGDKEDVEEPEDPTIEFQERVTSLLIPPKHLPRLEPVRVQRAWLQELARLSEAQRPPERRAKDGIDSLRTRAVLAADLVGGKGMAVEIKVSHSCDTLAWPLTNHLAQMGIFAKHQASFQGNQRRKDEVLSILHALAPKSPGRRYSSPWLLSYGSLLSQQDSYPQGCHGSLGRMGGKQRNREQPENFCGRKNDPSK